MYKEINLPQNLKLGIDSEVKVIRLSNQKNIVSLKSNIDKNIKYYKQNTKVIKFFLKDLIVLKHIHNLGYRNLNIVFDLNSKNILALNQIQQIVKKFKVTALLDSIIKPDDIVKTVKYLSSLGVKSELSFDIFKTFDKKVFEKITKEIVLDRELVKDVEPFFSMVKYVIASTNKAKTTQTLWSIFKDELDSFAYITDDRYLTISKRWDKRSRYLFNLDEKEETKYNSILYKEIDSYEQNLFVKNLECAMCESYEFCKAYLKFEDSSYECDSFLNTLNEIKNNLEIYKEKQIA